MDRRIALDVIVNDHIAGKVVPLEDCATQVLLDASAEIAFALQAQLLAFQFLPGSLEMPDKNQRTAGFQSIEALPFGYLLLLDGERSKLGNLQCEFTQLRPVGNGYGDIAGCIHVFLLCFVCLFDCLLFVSTFEFRISDLSFQYLPYVLAVSTMARKFASSVSRPH